MIAVIDYGAGNLGSVFKAFRYIGAQVEVTRDPEVVAAADGLVLPGVGAFSHCMRGLNGISMSGAVRSFIDSGRPFLGICVGLQMLFQSSQEQGGEPGLGALEGDVVKFDFGVNPEGLKVPHIGWNSLEFRPDAPLFQGLSQGDRVYFVHSYYPAPVDEAVIVATSDYGGPFCAAVQANNLHATQFHPEKSGAVGLQILRNFEALIA